MLLILAQVVNLIAMNNRILNFMFNFSLFNKGILRQDNKIQLKDDFSEPVDKLINGQINEYRDNVAGLNPEESLEKFKEIEQDNFANIHDKTKYRLLVNIASVYEQCNMESEASEYLINAKEYSEDCDAFYHAIYGYLLQSNKEISKALYQELKTKNPQSNYVFMAEILLNDFNEIYPLEATLPKNKLNEKDIVRVLITCYYQKKKDVEALFWLEKYHKLDSQDPKIQSMYAFSLLNFVMRDEIRFGEQWSKDDKNKLDLLIKLFLGLWEQYDSKKIKMLHLSDGINLCIALQLKGDVEKAGHVAKELLDIDNSHVDVCYQYANIFAKQGKYDEVIKALDLIFGKDDKTNFQLIELLFHDAQYEEVIKKFNKIIADSSNILNQEGLNVFQATALYNTQGKDSAYQFIDACSFLTFESKLNLFIFYKHIAKDPEKSSYLLKSIEDIFTNNMPYHDKLHLANIYSAIQEYHKAIELYQQLNITNQPSKILETLIGLLFKVDDRLGIKKILDNFNQNSKESDLYINTSVNFYSLVGEPDKALIQVKKAIQKEPKNLNIRLLWINILTKMQRNDEVREYLKRKPKFLNPTPEEMMQLAQLFHQYEQCKNAIELGYETLRSNWDNENCHMVYIGLMLLSTKDDFNVVGIDTTISITNDFNESKVYTIVNQADTNFNEIDLNHYIAKEAINKKTGDIFVTQFVQSKKWSIQEVVSKYTGLLRKSVSEFNDIFPDSNKMYSFQAREGREFEDIKSWIDDLGDQIDDICNIYQKQLIPVSSLAKFTKSNIIDLWQHFLSNKAIKVNLSTFDYQLKEPIKNDNGYIVDAITLYLIFVLDMHNDVKEYLENVAIVQATLDLFLQLKEKDTLNPQKVIRRQDSKYYSQEISIENIQNRNAFFQNLHDWAIVNFEIIPADGNLANEHEKFKKLFDPSTRETLIAAASSNRTLLTDDRNLREIGKHFEIESIFSKDILYWNEATENSKYYNYLHQLRSANCVYLPLEEGELWHWIDDCEIANNKLIPNNEMQEIKKYKDDFLNMVNLDKGYFRYMQISRSAVINVMIHILISDDTCKQIKIDWIMDNLYFNYDTFAYSNKNMIKEEELLSFLASSALLFYMGIPDIDIKDCMNWVDTKFIQSNKSSDLIKNVANNINNLFKELPTSQQVDLYVNTLINQLPVAIKNEVERIRGF